MVPPRPLITVYDKKHRVSGGDKHGDSRLLYCQLRGFLSFASTSHFCNIIIKQDCRQTFLLGLNIGDHHADIGHGTTITHGFGLCLTLDLRSRSSSVNLPYTHGRICFVWAVKCQCISPEKTCPICVPGWAYSGCNCHQCFVAFTEYRLLSRILNKYQ
ncbi:hypothetical protein QTP88_019482 [Uroleucon formosanum]